MKTHRFSLCALAATLSLTASVSMFAADQGPTPVSPPAPTYAFQLRHDEIEGDVTVSYTVTAQGDVKNVAVVNSSHRAFDGPTLAAIKGWKFIPAKKDGVPVSTRVRQIVSFELLYLHQENSELIARASAPSRTPTKIESAGDR
jgi:TonB family protein